MNNKVHMFLVYFNRFYGVYGLYPNTIPGYTNQHVLACIVSRGTSFEGDSLDRELIRDSILTLQGKDSEHGKWMEV